MIQRLKVLGVFVFRFMRAAGKEQRFVHAAVLADQLRIAQHILLPLIKICQTEQPDQMPLDPVF